jgi:hypothetical protein
MKIRFALLVSTAATAVLACVGGWLAAPPTADGLVQASLAPASVTAATEPATSAQIGVEPSVARRNTWSALGGSLARTRFTDTLAVLEGPLEMRLDIRPIGTLDSEPVFDETRVVTVSVDSGGKRQLEVFGLANGLAIGAAKELVGATEQVVPVFVDGNVVVRTTPALIEVYSIGKNGARKARSIKGAPETAFGHPILIGDDVVVAQGDTLVRYGPKGNKPVWTTPGAYRGHLTLVEKTLFALEYEPTTGVAKVAKIDAETGAVAEVRRIGRRTSGAPALPGDDIIAVHGKFAMVFGNAKFALETGTSTFSGAVDLSRPPESGGSLLTGSTYFAQQPAIFGMGWIGYTEHPIDGRSLVAMFASERGQNPTTPTRLAGAKWHEELLKFKQSPVFARSVGYFGGLAWDANTQRVLWREPRLEGVDVYPAKECILAVRDKKTIEVWRRQRAVEENSEIVAYTRPAKEEEGYILLRDGEEKRGTIALAGDGKSLEVMLVGATSRGWRAKDVAFAGLSDGRVLYAADRDALEDGVAALARDRQVALAEKACSAAEKSGDPSVMSKVFNFANALGVEEKVLDKLSKALDKARDGGGKVSAKQVEAANEALDKLDGVRAEVAYAALESLWIEPPPRPVYDEEAESEAASDDPIAALDARFATDPARRMPLHVYQLLEMTLLAEPKHEGARAKLLSLLPEDVELPAGRRVADWTKFAEANAVYPVELHFPPTDLVGDMTWEQEKLDQAVNGWRQDLIGYRSKKIFIITPVEEAGSIARSLALAEQLCTILESMFLGGQNERNTYDPLVVYLFGSRAEYLKEIGPGLEWTAGFYNPAERLSRLYVENSEEDAWRGVKEVLMHELTHHWLDVRNPRIAEGMDRDLIGGQKGYWIVEGFASLLQYFDPDFHTGEYETLDPRGDRIDNVANARDDQLLPAKVLYRREHVNLRALEDHSFDVLPLTWTLGALTQPGGVGLFYAQSAVTCMYLYEADGGVHRGKLYEYVVNYYSGNSDMLPIDAAFGMSEEELGKRVAEFGRQVVRDSLKKR